MTKRSINYGNGQIIAVGRTYIGTNGVQFTVEAIFDGDRFHLDRIEYRLTDGRTGETPPNSMFHWIDWTLAA